MIIKSNFDLPLLKILIDKPRKTDAKIRRQIIRFVNILSNLLIKNYRKRKEEVVSSEN